MSLVLLTPEALLYCQSAPHFDLLRQAGVEVRYPKNPHLVRGACSDAETIAEPQGASAVIAGGERYSEAVLQALPQLRVIARVGVGCDRVDVCAATARGIAVTITPTANHEAVAEHALALLLCVAKSVAENDRQIRSGQWTRALTEPVRRQTLGILGLGRIGRSTAVRAAALGMHVVASDSRPDEHFARTHGVELVSFEELLGRSDFLSLHCPLTKETRRLFNAEVFARMKPGAVLINTSRGGLVNETDLVKALQSGQLRAAGLDVFDPEPPRPDNPLLSLPNVVLTPHLAGTDRLSMQDMVIESARNVIELAQGRWPDEAIVNRELRGSWRWSTA